MNRRWLRFLRGALPTPWRRWLFDPSFAELIEAAHASGDSGPVLGLRALRLWLQCWLVGTISLLRRPFERARARRLGSPPTAPRLTNPETLVRSLLQDLRYAFRSLCSVPGFTTVAILTLALGTGVNTAIFGVVDLLMLRPLAGVTDGDELVFVMGSSTDLPFLMNLSYPNYEDLRDDLDGFDDLLAYTFRSISLTTADGLAERVYAYSVSANYFDLLGVQMRHGRGFEAAEGLVDTPAGVVVLDHAYWHSRLGADPDVVGSDVEINGVPFTVVGVTPEEFLGVESMLGPQLYLPIGGLVAIENDVDWLRSRRAGVFRVMGRLADGFIPAQADTSAAAAWERLRQAYPEDNDEAGLVVIPETSGRPDPSAGGQFAGIAVIFLVLVALVLTIACTNVANLMLARASGRVREIAIRSALGAGRARVVRQLATESALIGLAGGVAGVIIAIWSAATLRSVVASWQLELPVRLPLHIDLRVIAFGLVVAVGAGLIAGLLPALRASSGDLGLGLNEGSRGASGGRQRQRVRSLLVVAQVAVSVVLLVAAGLFVRSLQNARGAQLGFQTEGRLLLSFDPSVVGLDPIEGQELYRRLLERARTLPGVVAAGIVDAPAFSPRSAMTEVLEQERAPLSDERGVLTPFFRVSPGYLEAAGTRLIQGRELRDSDGADSSLVALINETMAAQLWPGADPVGKRFVSGSARDREWEVVGIVEQGKYVLVWEDPTPAFFIPLAQSYPDSATLVVHAAGDPLALVDPLRQTLSELAPTVPVFGALTMDAHLRDGRALMLVRLASGLVTAFGFLGITLATVGLYGVIAYSVTQRLREFGVRIALGAAPRSVLSMVLLQGLVLAAVGSVLGVLLAIATGRLIAPLLIELSATDPQIFGVGVGFALATAAIASLVPAWRATRVDPIVALRDE